MVNGKWLMVGAFVVVGSVILISNHKFSNSQIEQQIIKQLPYEKYSFENLAKRGGIASQIEVVGNKFYYYSEGRRISGEVNSVVGEVKGVIIMARGYVDKEIYKTGVGTHNAAKYYSEHGYVTYAPDFSGYGESDKEDLPAQAGANALGARLVKPVEILDLIASLPAQVGVPQDKPIFLWGHSNGGQIMLSVAEILGRVEPRGRTPRVLGVTLWAPVSKPFPYNILYYTDEASDSGKWLRGQVAEFEKDYDVFNYSIDKYLDWIELPIQLHQGTADEAVPKKWSDELVKNLKEKEKDVKYYIYFGADHNMRPAWDQVVARDVEFFNVK